MSNPQSPPTIQTQDPIDRFRKRAGKPSWPKVVGVSIAALVSMSLLWATVTVTVNSKPGDGAKGIRLAFAPKDDGLAEIEEWLKSNLDDPHYEIVRFWPKREMKEMREETVKSAKADLDNAVAKTFPNVLEFERYYSKVLKSPPEFACRIKFRAKNKVGAFEMRDEFFLIEDSKANPVDVAYYYRSYFPD